MPYASRTILAAYLGIDEGDVTATDERLLARAEGRIIDLTNTAVTIPTDPDTETLTAAQTACGEAVCAQVEWWRLNGEDDTQPQLVSMSIGRYSETRKLGGGNGSRPAVPARVAQALDRYGLRYAGRGVR